MRPWRAAGLDALFLPGGLPEPAQEQPASALPSSAAANKVPSSEPSAIPALAVACGDWPEPWQGIAVRLRAAPKIIITYASLTADVTGAADPARRKLFHSILSYLGWPQGTSLFWPCTDAFGAPKVARNVFLNGVLSFAVQHIACFGPEAAALAQALFPPGEGLPAVQVHALPAPEALLGLLPHELHRAVAALKALRLE